MDNTIKLLPELKTVRNYLEVILNNIIGTEMLKKKKSF